jgi:hypothetical protein
MKIHQISRTFQKLLVDLFNTTPKRPLHTPQYHSNNITPYTTPKRPLHTPQYHSNNITPKRPLHTPQYHSILHSNTPRQDSTTKFKIVTL